MLQKTVLGAVAGLALAVGANAAIAQSSEPLSVIVTWPAGGGTDIAARTILKYVEEELGTRADVRNIAGGGGAIGYVEGAKQEPNGQNLTTLQFDILSVEAQDLAPVSHEDFETVAMFADQPVVLMVKGDSPYKTLDDFVAAAKEGTLKVGGASIGGVWHQASHLMKQALGIEYTYVPYEGITGVMPAILGGHADAGVVFLSGTSGNIESGDLRILAVMSDERLADYPDVPTFGELGHDIVYSGFYGMAAPKGTARERVDELAQAFQAACKNPEYRKEAAGRELNPNCLGSDEFRTFLNEMYPKVEEISKELLSQ